MQRYCTQTVKIQFPNKIFMGSEYFINIPSKCGDAVSKIRVVLDIPSGNSTLRERIIKEAEITDTKEKLYGEFMYIENIITTPIEKQQKHTELVTGERVYIDLPFYSIEKYMFNQSINLRILLGGSETTSEIQGYLLVDFIVTESIPTIPYFQRIRKVQRLSCVASSSTDVVVDTYIHGPVYQLIFTVRDMDSDTYVDSIENITLLLNDRERFNLSGYYLRYVEPMKRHGRASLDVPMYMYSLCIDPSNTSITTGQSNFPENQRFKIKLFQNQSNYEIIIWALSHDFYYMKSEDTVLPVFESSEMVINSKSYSSSTSLESLPIKLSYTNISNIASISYTSNLEISHVTVSSNASLYTITQNEINFTQIDSITKSYYANVIFTSQGYSNLLCQFVFNGSSVMRDLIQREQGTYYFLISGNPIVKIDGGQRYNIASGGSLNNVALGIGTLDDFYIDQYRNYIVKSTNSGNLVYKYDQTLSKVLYAFTCSTSVMIGNIGSYFGTDVIPFSLLSSSGTISGISLTTGTRQGVVYNTRLQTFNTITCSSALVNIHSSRVDPQLNTYISGVTSGTGNIVISPGTTISTGTGKKAFMIKFNSLGVYEYIIICDNSDDAVKTDVNLTSNTSIIFTCYSTSLSVLYGKSANYSTTANTLNSFVFSNDGTYMSKNMKIENFTDVPTINKCFVDIFDNFFISFGYSSTKPSIVTAGVPGFGVVKFNKLNAVAFSISIKGDEVYNTFYDSVSTDLFIQCKNVSGSRNSINVFTNTTQTLTTNIPNSKTIILAFDSNGNYMNYARPVSNTSDFVTTIKQPYFTPLYDASYFLNSKSQTFTYDTYFWNVFATNAKCMSVSFTNTFIYFAGTSGPSASNVYNSNGISSKTINKATSVGNGFIVKYDSNGISQWTARFSPMTTTERVSFSADTNNNVYGTGYNYSGVGNMTLYNSDDTPYSTTVTDQTGFVVKYTPTGSIEWLCKIFGGGQVLTRFVKTDGENNIYFICDKNRFLTGVRMYSKDSLTSLLLNSGSVSMGKYSDQGVPLWCTTVSVNGNGDGGIATDSSNNVYMTATKYGASAATVYTVFPSPAPSITYTMPSSINSTQYVVKYNSLGTVQFIVYVQGTNSYADFGAKPVSVTTDASSNFYLCSSFSSGFGFTSAANVYNANNVLSSVWINSTINATDEIAYAVKFNSSGVAQWSVSVNGANADSSKSSTIDSSGNVYLAGFKTSTVGTIYDAGNTASSLVIPATASSCAFVIKFNSSGVAQWIVYVDGQVDDSSYSLSKDASGNILFGGYYKGENAKIYESNGCTYNLIKSTIGGNPVAFCFKIDSNGFITNV